MHITKKQLELIKLLKKCGGLYFNEINKSKYPYSMIKALEKKLVIRIENGKVLSNVI